MTRSEVAPTSQAEYEQDKHSRGLPGPRSGMSLFCQLKTFSSLLTPLIPYLQVPIRMVLPDLMEHLL